MERRKFLKTSAAAATAALIMPSFACKPEGKDTGLILYTVRKEMSEKPGETLDRIAEIGYKWLEAAGYSEGKFHGFKPADFKRNIESRGMKLISSHNSLNPGNMDEVIAAASEAGLKYLVIPSLPHSQVTTIDGLLSAAEFMNKAGEKCKQNGMKLGFHNHSIEFRPVDGQIPYEILMNNTDPDLVTFELDIAWITASGNDPVEYFNKFPGRYELLHIKDLTKENEDQTLGEGIIDFKPVFANADKAGMKYFFVEQDQPRAHSAMESIEISWNYLVNNIL